MAEAMEVNFPVDDSSVDFTAPVSDDEGISSSAHPPDPQRSSLHTQWVHPAHDHDYCKCDEIGYSLLRNDFDALVYTGITLQVFNILVSTLEGHASSAFTMSVRDQVLMTLMKLKMNRLMADLSNQFRISQRTASQIISYWIDKLEDVLQPLVPWLPRKTIQATMPEAFKENFPNTTCVLRCNKSFFQKTQSPDSREEPYRYYYEAVKYMVAVAPCGLIMFVSEVYGARSSEKFITKDSGLFDKLMPGDEVMVDQCSSVKELLLSRRRVKIVRPSLTAKERMEYIRHVETAITRLNAFQVLSQAISNTMALKIHKILTICAALVNLR